LLGYTSIQMAFDVYGHLFPSLEDDHAKSPRASWRWSADSEQRHRQGVGRNERQAAQKHRLLPLFGARR
jgi:hypothetical protein